MNIKTARPGRRILGHLVQVIFWWPPMRPGRWEFGTVLPSPRRTFFVSYSLGFVEVRVWSKESSKNMELPE